MGMYCEVSVASADDVKDVDLDDFMASPGNCYSNCCVIRKVVARIALLADG